MSKTLKPLSYICIHVSSDENLSSKKSESIKTSEARSKIQGIPQNFNDTKMLAERRHQEVKYKDFPLCLLKALRHQQQEVKYKDFPMFFMHNKMLAAMISPGPPRTQNCCICTFVSQKVVENWICIFICKQFINFQHFSLKIPSTETTSILGCCKF